MFISSLVPSGLALIPKTLSVDINRFYSFRKPRFWIGWPIRSKELHNQIKILEHEVWKVYYHVEYPIHMHMCTRGHHRMMTETCKSTNQFLLQHVFILISECTHPYNFFVLATLCQACERIPMKQLTLKLVSLITRFILINKLSCRYNFSLLASFILYGRCRINECVYLNMYHFCSIDNCMVTATQQNNKNLQNT